MIGCGPVGPRKFRSAQDVRSKSGASFFEHLYIYRDNLKVFWLWILSKLVFKHSEAFSISLRLILQFLFLLLSFVLPLSYVRFKNLTIIPTISVFSMHQLFIRAYKFWDYVPSIPAAVIFMLIFLVMTALHFWKLYKTRTGFCIAFTIGGLCMYTPIRIPLRSNMFTHCCILVQVIGYIGRCVAHNDTTTMGPYIVANIFILLSPTLFAATIYMTLGRLIRSIGGEHLSVIRISRLTKTFVWGDVLSFVVQGNSSSLSILGHPLWSKVAVVGGLAIQLVSFSIFLLTAIIFEKRIRHNPTPRSLIPGVSWRKSMYMLYAVSALIILRSIFRIIEYVLENDGYPLSHEWTMYIFDSVPMAIVMVIFYIWYPSGLKPRTDFEGSMPLAHTYSQV